MNNKFIGAESDSSAGTSKGPCVQIPSQSGYVLLAAWGSLGKVILRTLRVNYYRFPQNTGAKQLAGADESVLRNFALP